MIPMRLAILSFAHMHAFSYAAAVAQMEDVELVAVADPDAQRLASVRERWPQIPHTFSSHEELLKSVPCDAVIVTSENANHCAIALAAFAAGKHVLCEKPLATSVADAKRMIEAAQSAGRVLMTAFPVRFSPAVAEAKKVIAGGALGRLLGAVTSNHGSMPGGWFVRPSLSGGGAVIDHTVHVVDLLRWLFECEVAEVYAEYANRLHPDIPVEDVGLLSLRLENGLAVTLDTSWSRCKSYPIWGDVKLDIRGEEGRLFVNCFPMQVEWADDRVGCLKAFDVGENLDALMIEEFISAIREQRPPLVTGEDGLKALEVALAAYESKRLGRPVSLSGSQKV